MKRVAGPVEIASYDAKGNFLVVCDRKNLPAGDYLLTVEEAGNPKGEFHFAFTL